MSTQLQSETPRCPDCSLKLPLRTITIKTHSCWKCQASIKVATGSKNGEPLVQDYFTNDELEFAKQNGVSLERRYSFTAHGSYLANICSNCNLIQGNYFLYVALPPDNGTLELAEKQSHGPCDTCALRPCKRHGIYQDYRDTNQCPLCLFADGRPNCRENPDQECPSPGNCQESGCVMTNPFFPAPDRD